MQKFIDATYILDGISGDLKGAVLLLKETRRNDLLEHSDVLHKHVFRLCFTSIFMNCTKYVEFCTKYGKFLKDEIPEFSKLRNQFQESIKNKGIVSFRNDYIGHIHSKSMGRPLSNIETQKKLESCIGGSDSLPFLNWIYPDEHHLQDKDTYLVGVIESMYEALQKKL